MVSEGNLKVKDQISGFAGDLCRGIVLAGHHELRTLLANLLEDCIVPPCEEAIGVAVLFRLVPLSTRPKLQLCRWPGFRLPAPPLSG